MRFHILDGHFLKGSVARILASLAGAFVLSVAILPGSSHSDSSDLVVTRSPAGEENFVRQMADFTDLTPVISPV
jgi:hypothetical protein